MKKIIETMFMVVSVLLVFSIRCYSSPSTTYWTPCVMDVQSAGVWHITYDTYLSHSGAAPADLADDLGLTYGLKVSKNLNMELGVDWFSRGNAAAHNYPLYFNAKLGISEGSMGSNSPGLNLGIFNAGTKSGVTNFNIIDFILGKTIEGFGRIHLGYYNGNNRLLVSSKGNKEDDGFMAGFDIGFNPVKDADGEFNKFVVAGDYASGDNAIGGGGIGLYTYFTRNISLLVGPVWFNDQGLNGKVKWTTQIDINF